MTIFRQSFDPEGPQTLNGRRICLGHDKFFPALSDIEGFGGKKISKEDKLHNHNQQHLLPNRLLYNPVFHLLLQPGENLFLTKCIKLRSAENIHIPYPSVFHNDNYIVASHHR